MAKLKRYMLNGTTHSKGIGATFCVSWFVTDKNRVEPRAEHPIQYA
jgi:hypothetical protein